MSFPIEGRVHRRLPPDRPARPRVAAPYPQAETLLMPKLHVTRLDTLDDEQAADLADAVRRLTSDTVHFHAGAPA